MIFGGAVLPWLASTAVDMWRDHRARQNAKYLSDTAYQRSTRDLRAAGLSPIIAYGNPASSPVVQHGRTGDLGGSVQGAKRLKDVDVPKAVAEIDFWKASALEKGSSAKKLDQEVQNLRQANELLKVEKAYKEQELKFLVERGAFASPSPMMGILGSALKDVKSVGEMVGHAYDQWGPTGRAARESEVREDQKEKIRKRMAEAVRDENWELYDRLRRLLEP